MQNSEWLSDYSFTIPSHVLKNLHVQLDLYIFTELAMYLHVKLCRIQYVLIFWFFVNGW